MSPDDLLALLTPAQRATFDTTLQDPAKVTALVDAEFEGDQPWWENENAGPSGDGAASDEDEADMRPPFVDEQLLPPLKPNAEGKLLASPKLVYNVVAVLYVFYLSSAQSAPADETRNRFAASPTPILCAHSPSAPFRHFRRIRQNDIRRSR